MEEKLKQAMKKAFEAGVEYCNGGEFAYYAPDFETWYSSHVEELKF